MAIEVDLPLTEYGIGYTSTYCRIVRAFVQRNGGLEDRFSVQLQVAVYATNPQDMPLRELENKAYGVPIGEIETQAGDTFIAKCYAWVMAQPDMAGSTAV
jgi:hypothetical protein